MFHKIRLFILKCLQEHSHDQWVSKAQLYHATDTMLPPEFFIRWLEMKPRRPETPTSFRASVVSNTVRDLVRSGNVEREWIDEAGVAGSRWRIRLTQKGKQKAKELVQT